MPRLWSQLDLSCDRFATGSLRRRPDWVPDSPFPPFTPIALLFSLPSSVSSSLTHTDTLGSWCDSGDLLCESLLELRTLPQWHLNDSASVLLMRASHSSPCGRDSNPTASLDPGPTSIVISTASRHAHAHAPAHTRIQVSASETRTYSPHPPTSVPTRT